MAVESQTTMKLRHRLQKSSETNRTGGHEAVPPRDRSRERFAGGGFALISAFVAVFVLIRPAWLYYLLAAYGAALTLALATLPTFQAVRSRNPLMVNAVVTLCAAFVGVFLGTSLSAREASRIERQKVAQLLDVVVNEPQGISQGLSIVPAAASIGGAGYTLSNYIRENPQPLPEVFLSVLQSEMVLRNMSPGAFEALTSAKRGLLLVANGINGADSDDKITKWLPLYAKELVALSEIARAEAHRLDGDGNESSVARAVTDAIDKKTDSLAVPAGRSGAIARYSLGSARQNWLQNGQTELQEVLVSCSR